MNGEKLASEWSMQTIFTPCIYGGVTPIRSIHRSIIAIPSPELFVTGVHPADWSKDFWCKKNTEAAGVAEDAIKQWGNVRDWSRIWQKNELGRSLEDVTIGGKGYTIPGFDEVNRNAKEAGALGGGISGSGPSVFILSKDEKQPGGNSDERIYIPVLGSNY